jgi:PAS domain S-box-containing protein
LDANPFMTMLVGCSHDELRGKELHEIGLFDDHEASRALLRKLIDTGEIRFEHLPLATKSGERRDIELICNAHREDEKTIVQCNIRDITARKQAEEALRKAQAILADRAGQLEDIVSQRTAKLQELIGELEGLSYSITHDLRAPLRALQGFSHMLLAEHADGLDDSGKDLLRRIRGGASRMDKLIQDVLAYSRVLRLDLRLESVNVQRLLIEMLESYPEFQEQGAGIALEGELPAVLANEAALTQCFSNLLGNAVKFVGPGVKPRVRISAEQRGEMVRFWVADNGIGIAERFREQIFGMFQRLDTSHEGTGIGLAILGKAVARMGGTAGVESEPGLGSRFWIELKAATPTQTDP